MNSLVLICTLVSCSVAFICAITTSTLLRRINELESDILDCATRGRNTHLELNTLSNKVNKPKAKRGRPRKNAPKPHKIIHQLDGE